jgi:FMN phosphatase YigB (HAD superfamily)
MFVSLYTIYPQGPISPKCALCVIYVRVTDGVIKSGKINHLESAIQHLQARVTAAEFSASTVVLIDDDLNNIYFAKQYGLRAVVCDPLGPDTMLTDILDLR